MPNKGRVNKEVKSKGLLYLPTGLSGEGGTGIMDPA